MLTNSYLVKLEFALTGPLRKIIISPFYFFSNWLYSLQVLTKEDMTDADRDDRDSFLECLQDHIHDVHAHVRSHALQIWAKLCTNKCIPLTRQHQILELAVGRLMVPLFLHFQTLLV